MANIIRKIKTSIETATGIPFIYGGNHAVNTLIETAPLPCAIAYLVDNSQVVDEAGILHERLNIAVFFVNKTNFDADSLDNEDVIDTMKKKAFIWLQSARQRMNVDGLKIGVVGNAQRIYDEFDVIVTGYGITVPIDEIEGVSQCDIPEPEPEPDENEGE